MSLRSLGDVVFSRRIHTMNIRAPLLGAVLWCLLLVSVQSAEATSTPSNGGGFVTVTGDVKSPGKVPWVPGMTLLQSIVGAGGGGWNPTSVFLVRGAERTRFRLRDLIRDTASGPTLQAGDTIELR